MWRKPSLPLRSYAEWIAKVALKNREAGTSAPTLAAAWSGVVELYGALADQPSLAGFVIEQAAVEGTSVFDTYDGPRNHDLVLRGHVPSGDRVVVCVEAKAGEDLGDTIEKQRVRAGKAVQKAEQEGKTSNQEKRLHELLERFVMPGTPPELVETLRYQLFTGFAGTIAEAAELGTKHAVFMVHDFLTDQRPKDLAAQHDTELREFFNAVMGVELPSELAPPLCIALGQFPDTPGVELYLARVVTDLRASVLKKPSGR